MKMPATVGFEAYRPPALRLHFDDGLIVDNFAGGGGASTGIEWALGRSPDVAINHDPEAIAMHAANHPGTQHLCGSVFDYDPIRITAGLRVALAWFSPDCKHHSKAKGGKPRDQKIRGLAWVAVRWAREVGPDVIMLENVEEFRDWGPLVDGRPCEVRKGLTYRRWKRDLEAAGYVVEDRILRACDYGAPTTRKRLFVIARKDGRAIRWPVPSHVPAQYRTAAECVDWSIPCPSIFGPDRDLAENTLRRIAKGVVKFVLEAAKPFLVPLTHHGDRRIPGLEEPFQTVTCASRGETALAVPYLVQTGYGEREGQAPRVPDIHRPLGTVVAGGQKHAVCVAHLMKNYGGNESTKGGTALDRPVDTVTSKDHHSLVTSHVVKLKGTCRDGQAINTPLHTVQAGGLHYGEVRTLLQRLGPDNLRRARRVAAFLIKYYGTGVAQGLEEPLDTVTTRDRYALITVTIEGEEYVLVDIGMRMLTPRELARAQGFPDSYVLDPIFEGKPLTKTAQIKMIGNSVCPPLAAQIVKANFEDLASELGDRRKVKPAGGTLRRVARRAQ